jgi:hypothetical protein
MAMNLTQISFDSLPPIEVPFRYFLTAPLFIIAIALIMLLGDHYWWVSRWQTSTLVLTHTFTLGFITTIMLGALFQLLPVAAGISVPKASLIATVNHIFHTLGSICLIVSFFSFNNTLQLMAMLFLGSGFTLYIVMFTYALFSSKLNNSTIFGLKLAIISLGITVTLGLLLASGFSWINDVKKLTNLHALWGIIGWFLVVIFTISFKIIPMFYVAPEFSFTIKRNITTALFTLLCILVVAINHAHLTTIIIGTIFIVSGIYSYYLIIILNNRKRKIADVTVSYWLFATFSLFIIIASYFMPQSLLPKIILEKYSMLTVALFFFNYCVSIIEGMLLKILPFLTFTHLQNLSAFNFKAMQALPNMHQILPKKRGRILFLLHFVSSVMLISSLFQSQLTWLLGLSWLLEFTWLFILVSSTWYKYYACRNQIIALLS